MSSDALTRINVDQLSHAVSGILAQIPAVQCSISDAEGNASDYNAQHLSRPAFDSSSTVTSVAYSDMLLTIANLVKSGAVADSSPASHISPTTCSSPKVLKYKKQTIKPSKQTYKPSLPAQRAIASKAPINNALSGYAVLEGRNPVRSTACDSPQLARPASPSHEGQSVLVKSMDSVHQANRAATEMPTVPPVPSTATVPVENMSQTSCDVISMPNNTFSYCYSESDVMLMNHDSSSVEARLQTHANVTMGQVDVDTSSGVPVPQYTQSVIEPDKVLYDDDMDEIDTSHSTEIVRNLEGDMTNKVIMSAYCIECNRVWKTGCPHHIHTYTHIPDSAVYTRAIATLPSILSLVPVKNHIGYNVVANSDIEPRTVFGPLEGKRLTNDNGKDIHGDDPRHWQIFLSVSNQLIDCTDQSIANWFMFLERAPRNQDQNLVAYQHGKDIYFVCKRKINAGEKLCYWFSSDYAQLLGLSPYPESVFSCEHCKKDFESTKQLKAHTMRQHSTSGRFNKCDICDKNFPSASKLKAHALTHTGEKPHQCDVCHKFYSSASNLKKHMVTHTSEKKFVCKSCGIGFTQKAHLKNHELVHTQQKNFECRYCKMKFARSYDLRSHINCLHLKEKSYPCHHCKAIFYRPGALKRHLVQITSSRVFHCPKCLKGFMSKYHMTRHLKSCKSKPPEAEREPVAAPEMQIQAHDVFVDDSWSMADSFTLSEDNFT